MTRFFLFLFALSFTGHSQNLQHSGEILHGMQKLGVCGSVLYIAAHPDDENTRLLAYLANEKKIRTGYLSLTRGDGGQNLIGNEQGEALGLIRTQELLAARRTDGAEQYFTRAYDFGYSKTPEETLKIWNKDSILNDMVFIIRYFKPDVIICRFPTTGEGGHGHHTASALLAVEAFDAAADPKKFPYQLKLVDTWKTRRIFWNTFNFGSNNTTSENQLKLDVGTFNPLLGVSYGEIAGRSRSMHRSQGFGSAKVRGTITEYFKYLKGDTVSRDIFQDIDLSLNRLPGASALLSGVSTLTSGYSATAPSQSIPELLKLRTVLLKMEEKDRFISYWKKQKIKECDELVLACSGIWAEYLASGNNFSPGSAITTSLQIVNRSTEKVVLTKVRFGDRDTATSAALAQNQVTTIKQNVKIDPRREFSEPYWLKNKKNSAGLFSIAHYTQLTIPENTPPLNVVAEFSIGDQKLNIERPLVYKLVDPVKSEIYTPVHILPPVSIEPVAKAVVFGDNSEKIIRVHVKSTSAPFTGELKAVADKGWQITVAVNCCKVELNASQNEMVFEFAVKPTGNSSPKGQIRFSVTSGKDVYDKSVKRINYDHIPSQFMLTDASVALVRTEIKLGGARIAYIPGAGDDVAQALSQIGYNVDVLTDEQIAANDLSVYDAIVTGVRAYNVNEKLKKIQWRLHSYVEHGGNLVVQYNTNSRVGPLDVKLGPYPFTISRERTTDENAPVEFNKPEHPALNSPNKITPADFKDWIQERGIYFATDTDPKYEHLLKMNDPGEKPHQGSLIVAPFGKGNFVYTGLAFFRQLPAGVPGAYRLFVNLLSLPKHEP